jgi:integrase
VTRRSPGEGTVFPYGPGFAAQLTYQYVTRTVYARTKAEAHKKLDELKRRRDEGRWHVEANQTVSDVIGGWIETVGQRGLAYRTLRVYGVHANHLKRYLGTHRVEKLQARDIRSAYARMEKDGLGEATVSYCHTVLGMVLRQALKERVISWNPHIAVERKAYRAKEKSILTREQLLLLFEQTEGTREYAAWVIMGTAALRDGELLALRWDDIDFERGMIRIDEQLEARPGEIWFVEPKRGSKRTIAVSRRAVIALRAHQRLQVSEREAALRRGIRWPDTNLVFPTPDGQPQVHAQLQRAFTRDIARQSIVDVTPHSLRHTAITLLLADGKPLADVSKWAGHKDPTVTMQIYAHAIPEHQEQMGRWMDEILERGA